MSRNSCIAHPANAYFLIIRPEYLAITDGNECAAALLHIIEHWHNVKLDTAEESHEQNKAAERYGQDAAQDETFWWYKTYRAFREETLFLYGEKKIASALGLLVERGFLYTRSNPKNTWDQTGQYLFDAFRVQTAINEWAEAELSEGDQPESTEPSNPPNGGMQKANLRNARRQMADSKYRDQSLDQNLFKPKTKRKTLAAKAAGGSPAPISKPQFFKTKYYPVDQANRTIFLKHYHAGEYDHLLSEWANRGIAPVLGHLLNTDPIYADFARIEIDTPRNVLFDAVARFLYPNLPGNFKPDALGKGGGHVGEVRKALLELLSVPLPTKEQQADIARNVDAAYRRWKAASRLHSPRDTATVLDWYFHCLNNPESADRQAVDAMKFKNNQKPKEQESPDEQAEFERKVQSSRFNRNKLAG